MNTLKNISAWALAIAMAVPFHPGLALGQALPPRPPQYILISFDGSYTPEMWKATREHAQKTGAKVTHFISGVDFLMGSDRRKIDGAVDSIYIPPRYKGGRRSDIGFGGDRTEMNRRIYEMNENMKAGMEIGGHGNSHFNGSSWSLEDWTFEFNQFHKFLFEAFSLNKLQESQTRVQESEWRNNLLPHLRSFRAPYLGRGEGLWKTLGQTQWKIDGKAREHRFIYDASAVADSPTSWPTKSNLGFWFFRMAIIPVPGLNHGVLSMDYNFYVAHSDNPNSPKDKLEKIQEFEEQMYQAYMSWFQRNYHGNRAPINIGHHFSTWNKGAYWKALKRFMTDVCQQAEVKCTTGLELAEYLESVPASALALLKQGQFDRKNLPRLAIASLDQSRISSSVLSQNKFYRWSQEGFADLPRKENVDFSWRASNGETSRTRLNLERLAARGIHGLELVAKDSEDREEVKKMIIDWDAREGRYRLAPQQEPLVMGCTWEAHREQVDLSVLDDE
ncbi:MAG: hypothetical protein LW875_11995 [Proteobacteria bacterium]|jgi:hypothetical protein|nr:hypothetical protein [Pseudomonadota bacterium]